MVTLYDMMKKYDSENKLMIAMTIGDGVVMGLAILTRC